MSVIAKMSFAGQPTKLPSGDQWTLHCVYDNRIAEADGEDVRFTKATPWGQGVITIENPEIKAKVRPSMPVYLLFDPFEDGDESPNLDGVFAAATVRCHGDTDYGGTSHTIEIECTADRQLNVPTDLRFAEQTNINLKLAIDNPPAAAFFKPQSRYLVRFYDASVLTQDKALALAHGASFAEVD